MQKSNQIRITIPENYRNKKYMLWYFIKMQAVHLVVSEIEVKNQICEILGWKSSRTLRYRLNGQRNLTNVQLDLLSEYFNCSKEDLKTESYLVKAID